MHQNSRTAMWKSKNVPGVIPPLQGRGGRERICHHPLFFLNSSTGNIWTQRNEGSRLISHDNLARLAANLLGLDRREAIVSSKKM